MVVHFVVVVVVCLFTLLYLPARGKKAHNHHHYENIPFSLTTFYNDVQL